MGICILSKSSVWAFLRRALFGSVPIRLLLVAGCHRFQRHVARVAASWPPNLASNILMIEKYRAKRYPINCGMYSVVCLFRCP